MNFLQNYHKKRRFEGQYSSSKKKTRKSINLIFLVFCCKYMKPSRKTIKPVPHKCPSRSTLMNVPHESSPSKTLITRIRTDRRRYYEVVGEVAKAASFTYRTIYIEYFLRNRPKYSIRFALCIVKKYNIIEQTRRKCTKCAIKENDI